MSKLNFEYVPLTFISNKEEIKKEIKNTLILIHLFEKYNKPTLLKNLIEGTQYGYNASALLSGQNKFLRISDIHESKVDWETVPYCNCEVEETYLLKNEDILIARTGGTTGKSFKIDTPPPHSIYAGYLIRIRAKQTVNPDYLYLFLHSFAYWSQIVNLNEGNFRPKANAENLKTLILPNCSKNIQDDAVRISLGENLPGYEELFDKIEKVLLEYEKIQKIEELFADQLTQLDNLNQAILQEAVQSKLVSQDSNDEPAAVLLKHIKTEKTKSEKKEKPLPLINPEEIPFEIPESWVWCRIDELVSNQREDIRTGPFGTALNKGEHKKTGIPVWGIESISKNGRFTNENKIFVTEKKAIELKSFGVKGGDLIISRSGTIGELCMLPYDIHFGLLSTNLMKISVNRDVIMPEYFCHIIKSRGYVDDMLKEFCKGSTRLFLTQNILNRLIFPLPPLSEQKRIVAEIEKQFEKTKQLKEHVIANQQATEKLLKALLHGAFEVEEKRKNT